MKTDEVKKLVAALLQKVSKKEIRNNRQLQKQTKELITNLNINLNKGELREIFYNFDNIIFNN